MLWTPSTAGDPVNVMLTTFSLKCFDNLRPYFQILEIFLYFLLNECPVKIRNSVFQTIRPPFSTVNYLVDFSLIMSLSLHRNKLLKKK